ncbi:hypothetical protein BCR42DRAFT_20484 [Absidia repens]|uniref:Uncharacterized protein n=1 Tax=Absidia repens TaxID=90262 RepID=A0A1X2J2T2_9FUNG|nr:hypothetical protein BCR42DRAFT_20484 [Absidia repens]
MRTSSALDRDRGRNNPLLQQQNDFEDNYRTNISARTPHRSTSITKHMHSINTSINSSRLLYSTPNRKTMHLDPSVSPTLCPSSPSVILQDHLQEESQRLEQLQHDIFVIQQRSFTLSHFGSPSLLSDQRLFTTSESQKNSGLIDTNSYLSPSRQRQRQKQQRQYPYPTTKKHLYQNKEYTHHLGTTDAPECHPTSTTHQRTQTESPVSYRPSNPHPVFTTSTPLGSPSTTHQSLERQQHPLFSTLSSRLLSSPAPAQKKTTRSPTDITTHSHLIPSSSPTFHPSNSTPSPSHQQDIMNDLLSNVPVVQSRPCENINTSNINQNTNKFRGEVRRVNNELLSPTQQQYQHQTNTIHSTTLAPTPRHRETGKQQEQPSLPPTEEDSLYWNSIESEQHQLRYTKTLDQELEMAKSKLNQSRQRQHDRQVESKTFSLRPCPISDYPLLVDDDKADPHQSTIDGDRWTFAGQHYTVDEK